MRVLVILGQGAEVDETLLANLTRMEVKRDKPPEEGIFIMNSDKEPDWAWPDYVFRVGDINLGRHSAIPVEIGTAAQVATEIGDALESLEGDNEEGEATGD